MYVMIPQREHKAGEIECFAEKNSLANRSRVHRHTITNWFKGTDRVEQKGFTIYYTEEYTPKTKKTGFTQSKRDEKGEREW